MQLAWRSTIDKQSEQYDRIAIIERRHPVTTISIWFLRSLFVIAGGDVIFIHTTLPAMQPDLDA